MRNRRVVVLLIVIVLVGAFAIWRGITLHQRRAAIFPPTIMKEEVVLDELRSLPGGEFLTEEDAKALAKVVSENPLPADAESLTEDDTKFLIENEVLDEDEARMLLRLEKLLRSELHE